MKTLIEIMELKRIKKLEEMYIETIDFAVGQLLDLAIEDYEEKYKKDYINYN